MRKCWNCGQPTNDEQSGVCSDDICQRAAKKSWYGNEVKFDYLERSRTRESMKNFRLKKEHDKVAKAAAKAAAETAFDYAYTAAYAATFSEDYAIGCAAAAARDAYFAASTEADEDVIAKAKAEEEHYKPIKRQPSQKRLRVVSAPESRERMKKAMQDLGMTEELKLFFGEE
jgi:hypothetical protein